MACWNRTRIIEVRGLKSEVGSQKVPVFSDIQLQTSDFIFVYCVMKQTIIVLFILASGVSCIAQNYFKTDKALVQTAQKNITDAVAQYKVMMKTLPPDKFPKTFDPKTGKPEFSGSDWWCSGFYPGTLLYLYEQTKDNSLYNEAIRILDVLKKEQFNTTTHDLGFMMNCSFGHANRLHPRPEYDTILLNSARSLSTRYNDTVGCIRSWNGKPGEFLVIIDNMMNLELLFRATHASRDSSFYYIATRHANTTMKNHFRADYSSYHVINYDSATGAVQEKKTAQGFANESAWARGQAWGLYGYTETYRETKDKRYLQQAQHIADFILNHKNLPADKIPYWDFNAPDIPNTLRDASAGAIIASALLELSLYADKKSATRYFKTAETIIRTLSTAQYKAPIGTNGGYILMHGVGHKPVGSEVDMPLTYGDYYFVEACYRYIDLSKFHK
jgi:unsaturated chondroitin disaccharide hydrolase